MTTTEVKGLLKSVPDMVQAISEYKKNPLEQEPRDIRKMRYKLKYIQNTFTLLSEDNVRRIELHFFKGYSIKEIAEIEKKSYSLIALRVRENVKFIRERLSKFE